MDGLRNRKGEVLSLSEVLARHAVIEASAGTGKTYTIEHLVLQILIDFPAVSLRNILLVTYTEKAAGELRERIRERLSRAATDAATPSSLAAKFMAELDDFDSASISTIHGFCNRVLMEFAFENARPLELEQGTDALVRERLLNEIVRTEWPRINAAAKGRDGSKSIVSEALDRLRDILQVAGQVRMGDGLLPEFEGDLADAATADEVAVWTARRLIARMNEERRASSRVTFDDMISDVRAAVRSTGPDGRALLERLRRRYTFGVVDEFQDTDPDQWDIFKAVFMEGGGANRLIVVGDPKQAIYGFRGADIRTYLDARDEIARCGGNVLDLDTNWRSSKYMVAGFNRMFCIDGWFSWRRAASATKSKKGTPQPPVDVSDSEGAGTISCPELKAAPEAVESGLVADRSGRAAVVPVQICRPDGTEKLAADEARYRFASFAAREIGHLMDDSGIVLPGRNGQPARPLSYDDICILIHRHDDFALISRLLRAAGIPHAQYKQKKLYESAEAENALAMLRALAGAGAESYREAVNSVLLSRFFYAGGDPVEAISPARFALASEKLAGWRVLADSQNWPRLFEALAGDTGLFVREALQFDGERRLANWRQIFGELAGFADSGSLDIHGLTGRLELLRAGDAEEEDSRMNRLESELPKVRVLTIHAAKGLEFPVVFVAAGFGLSNERSWRRGWKGGRRWFEMGVAGGSGLAVDEDLPRLFYVALTRAMYKLYLPANWVQARGSQAPMKTFMKAGIDNLTAADDVEGAVWSAVAHDGRAIGKPAPFVEGVPNRAAVTGQGRAHDFDLSPALQVNWQMRRFWVDSYSSLTGYTGRSHFTVEGVSADRVDEAPEDAAPEAAEVQSGAVSLIDGGTGSRVPLLPSGRKTGQAFHELMEDIASRRPVAGGGRLDFLAFRDIASPAGLLASPAGRALRQKMARNGIPDRELWSAQGGGNDSAALQFAGLVMNALKTPLGTSAPLDFRMCDIPSADTLAELEFHLDERDFGRSGDPGLPPWRSGLLNGFIDLVFRRDGRFWFLDWKTTTIRPGAGAAAGACQWSGRLLDDAMVEHRYIVQAHVYRMAMLRWLEQHFGGGAAGMFGGGLFLFMRGMDAPGVGVWNSLKAFGDCTVAESGALVGRFLSDSAGNVSNGGGW